MKIFLGQKNNGKPLSEYYASLKGMWEEWNAYQPLLVDIKVPRRQMGRVLGMILRKLPHLPTVKGSGGPFIRGQGRGGKGRGKCRSDRLCSHCCGNREFITLSLDDYNKLVLMVFRDVLVIQHQYSYCYLSTFRISTQRG
ncbi:hypothetical protein CK203_052785 [Vitis vinifera]|uniref:Uncharacterized protein n=1 Tax=Vitis vinifera TaxID=29760 RepID=A0A438FUS9_VITVI|nr:hypothetical protein CK203_052785 [Vitis vinifera]